MWHWISTKPLLLKGNAKGNHVTVKMHLAPNMYKFITVKANAKKIVRCKMCLTCQICTKPSLWRQMLRKSLIQNAFLTLNMHKIVTLKTNAKEIVTVKMHYDHQISTKMFLWRQMLRKSLLDKYNWHQKCTKSLMWRQMLRKSAL